MGVLRQAMRRSRRATPALDSLLGGGFVPTQPGDPDFSRAETPGSQLQFPAAAAESRVEDVRTRAANQLAAAQTAGIDVTGSEFEGLRDAARQGFVDREPSLGEKLLGWVGAPFETINLTLQGMISPDANVSLGDYANALWGGIEDPAEFTDRTGLDPTSFSETLTMFGWEPADEVGLESVARGIVDFTGSMLIDPLTYVTGGLAGLGRKTAVAFGRRTQAGITSQVFNILNDPQNYDDGGRLLKEVVDNADVSDYTKELLRTRDKTLADFREVMQDHLDDIAHGNFDNPVVKDLNRYLGDVGPRGDNVFQNWEELALAHRIGNEVIRPLAQRNFEAIAPLALLELPVWARGGLRLGLPSFSTRFADVAVEIPHTRGLGRKLLGNPLRELSSRLKSFSPKYKKVAEAISSGRVGFDSYRPILNGLRDGTFEPWQYHMLESSMNAIHNQAFRQQITVTLHHHAQVLNKAAEAAGEDPDSVYRMLLDRLQNSGDDAALMAEAEKLTEAMSGAAVSKGTVTGQPKAVRDAVEEAATYIRQVYDDLHETASKLDPRWAEKYIEGYSPYIVSDAGAQIIGEFNTKAANVARRDWVEAADRGEPGRGLLARIMNAWGGGGREETSLGATRFLQERTTRVQAQLIADDGPILLDDNFVTDLLLKQQAVQPVSVSGEVAANVLETRYPSIQQLNEWLEAAVRENADRFGIVIPKDWDGKIFNDNPIDTAAQYVGAMDDAIKQWQFIDAAKMAGLTVRHSTAIDVQDVIQKVMSNIVRISKKTPSPSKAAADDIINEVRENPDKFAFHSTEADKAEAILGRRMGAGGLFGKREPAEQFVRHAQPVPDIEDIEITRTRNLAGNKGYNTEVGEFSVTRLGTNEWVITWPNTQAPDAVVGTLKEAEDEIRHAVRQQLQEAAQEVQPGQRKVLVFDRDELPPSIRNPLERAGEIGNIRGAPKIKPIGSYDPAEGLESFVPAPHMQNILEGRQNLVDGVPRKAVKPMREAGLDPSDMRGTRELYQTVEGITKEAFREMRQTADDFLPDFAAGPIGFAVDEAADGPVIKFAIDPNLATEDRDRLYEGALRSLDRVFMEGDLKGQLNHETMVRLARNAPNEDTSDLLFDYYRNKMASLGDGAREFLGSKPGEFVETTVLADEFWEATNEFLTDYSAWRSSTTGELLYGGQQARQLADFKGEIADRLSALRKASRTLGERGYDEAVDVMRQVMDVTGVQDLPGYMKPHDLGLAGPALTGMLVQRDIGLWLKNVSRNMATVYTPEGITAAKMATNELLRTWRALATIARPAFHIRNAIGAGWMNMTVGVRAETYQRLSTNTLKWRKALREGLEDPYSVLDDDIRAAWRAMNDEDVLSGFVTSEFRKPLTGAEKEERLKFLNMADVDNFVLTRAGGRVMESIEDVARAALFLEYFDEAVEGSAKSAAEIVKAVHFDYSDLTPWETKIKSLVPFFVWTRRNLPRQIEMMVERPGMVQRYRHMMDAMDDNLGRDENGLPEGDLFSAYAAGTGIYVNPGTPFWARVMVDPDLPVTDLLDLPNPLDVGEMGDFVNNLLGPHVGTLIDINEQREWSDVNAPAPMNTILKGLAAIGFFDETLDGDVRIPYWLRTVGETAVPFSRDVIDPLAGGPTDPNRQQRLGISQEDGGLESSLKALLGTLGRGVGIKFNTPVDVRSQAARSQEELDAIVRELREQGQLPGSGAGGGPLDTLLRGLG